MDVLGHDDVAEYCETVTGPKCFQHVLEDRFAMRGVEQRPAFVAAEGDEMEVAFVLETLEAYRHGAIVGEIGRGRRAFARLPTHDEKMS